MFTLPDLPYAKNALEPTLSERLMTIHHDKHHKTYVDNLNGILKEKGESPATLEAVVKASAGDAAQKKTFNNAGQIWNHGFLWESMTPDYAPPTGALAEAIERDFGGLEALKTRFVEEGAGHFASGWAWIVVDGGKLVVTSYHDADSPLAHGKAPILVSDVWEHAYYLDYQQDRKGFLGQWFDKLANWTFAGAQYDAAVKGAPGWTYPAPT